MKESLLKAYQNAMDNVDRWFTCVMRDENQRNKRDDAVECIYCIGIAKMLARILQKDYGINTQKDRENMKKIKDYLKYDFLDELGKA